MATIKLSRSQWEFIGKKAGWMEVRAKETLSVFDKHQIAIAKKTLKMNDVGADIMGGMTKEEARKILKKHNISFSE